MPTVVVEHIHPLEPVELGGECAACISEDEPAGWSQRFGNEIVFQLISSMPFRHVKAHKAPVSATRECFQNVCGKRTEENSCFDDDPRLGGPNSDVQRFAIKFRRCPRVTRDRGIKLCQPATVFDPEGRALQFLQVRPRVAIENSTDELKRPIALFTRAKSSFFVLKLQPVQPVIDDAHGGLYRRQESRGDVHGNLTSGVAKASGDLTEDERRSSSARDESF